jgi:hypothetical protein
MPVNLRIAIKCGAIIAAGIAIWVLSDHYVLHITRPGSRAAFLTPLVFNLLQLVMLFLGIRARRREDNDKLTLGQGISVGLAISLAYGVFACLFFLGYYLIAGSKILQNEPGYEQPERLVLLKAYAGLFLGALIAGLIYSTVISFALRTVPQEKPHKQSRSQTQRSRRRR